jgi:hypothetical protein
MKLEKFEVTALWAAFLPLAAVLFLVFVAFSMAGCAAIVPAVQKVRAANDAVLGAAEFEICEAATIGAVKRRYGQDKVKARAWRDLCVESNNSVVELVSP